MTPSNHADIEALSGFVDGEAPEWADHVAGCAQCGAAADRLRAMSAVISGRVDPPPAAVREQAIAAALAAMSAAAAPGAVAQPRIAAVHEAERARFAWRGASRPWAMPAVAAVVVGILGLSGLVLSSYRTSDHATTSAGPALESSKADSAGGTSASVAAPPGDLGDVADAATLANRARAAYAPSASAGRSSSSSNSSPAADLSAVSGTAPGSAAQAATPTTTLTQRATAPSVAGTRPCEEQARAREPGLGPVVYFATAHKGSVAGFVLGFGVVGNPSSTPVTVVLLAQNGCAELLRAAGP